jgi:hypothetical protein
MTKRPEKSLSMLAVAALAALSVLLVLILTGGCATPSDETSSIPWNRPQQWEKSGGTGLPY